MLTIVTGWSDEGLEIYGNKFLETFEQFGNPHGMDLQVYTNERQESEIQECKAFLKRHANNAAARGEVAQNCWKPKEIANKYSFRTDAYKFCRQVYAIWHAAKNAQTEYVAWFDGDVEFRGRFDAPTICNYLPETGGFAYLGREPWHPDIAFQIYRVPDALPFLYDWVDWYTSDRIFDLAEWHSAYAFDKARRNSPVRAHNLTPARGDHAVWARSPLAAWSGHNKGKLKYAAA